MKRKGRPSTRGFAAGVTGTLVIHTVAALLLFVSAGIATPIVETYAVKLTAAPAPTDQKRLAPEAVPRQVERTAPTKPPVKKPAVVPPPPKPTAKPTERVEKAPATSNPVTPLPGEQPSTGNQVATIDLRGKAFPYPEYLENIIGQILRNWERPLSNSALYAEVSFVILRDGSVKEIQVTRTSRNYGFDLSARGAVEAASNARAFGPLPEGYAGDALSITFFFKPRTTP